MGKIQLPGENMKFVYLAVLSLITLSVVAAPAEAKIQKAPVAIIGGSRVPFTDPVANSTVMIMGQEFGGGTFICSSTIISKNLLLTAAHCVGMGGPVQLVAVFRGAIEEEGPVIQITDFERPADFFQRAQLGDTDWHDIAVVKLATDIPPGYQPAKVLDAGVNTLRDGDPVVLAGYGMSLPLSPTDGSDSGSGTLRFVDQTIRQAQFGSTEMLINLDNGRGACHGDSGGPAYIRSGNDIYLAGVASRMTENDRVANNGDVNDFSCTVEMVYTSVSAQSAWIHEASQALLNR